MAATASPRPRSGARKVTVRHNWRHLGGDAQLLWNPLTKDWESWPIMLDLARPRLHPVLPIARIFTDDGKIEDYSDNQPEIWLLDADGVWWSGQIRPWISKDGTFIERFEAWDLSHWTVEK